MNNIIEWNSSEPITKPGFYQNVYSGFYEFWSTVEKTGNFECILRISIPMSTDNIVEMVEELLYAWSNNIHLPQHVVIH